MMKLLPQVQAMPASPSRVRLRNAIALKSAVVHNQGCSSYISSKDALWETRHLMSLKDTSEKILFMKVIENWNIPEAVPWLKEIINDNTNPLNLRIHALTLKGKSDPLFDSAKNDIFFRSLEAFEGKRHPSHEIKTGETSINYSNFRTVPSSLFL